MARARKKPAAAAPPIVDETAGIEREVKRADMAGGDRAAPPDEVDTALVLMIKDGHCPGPNAIEVFASEVEAYRTAGWRRADEDRG